MSRLRDEHEAEEARKRKLAAAFGEPLPEGSRDDLPEAWGDDRSPREGAGDDEWLRRQVPPHHG